MNHIFAFVFVLARGYFMFFVSLYKRFRRISQPKHKQKSMDGHSPPLHTSKVDQPRATINRAHTLIHSLAILSLLYYRFSSLFWGTEPIPTFPWVLITASELLLSFFWVLGQAFRWRPVTRTVFPERLPSDEQLPPIDVFICTADPTKEPPIGVMNTVISAMCLDYPPDKLSVYLSDDAGASITLFALREAFSFARSWVPFCKRHRIKTICPEAYFSGREDMNKVDDGYNDIKLIADREDMKLRYRAFKQCLEKGGKGDKGYISSQDHPPVVEVIRCSGVEEDMDKDTMPLLVYVSREKRPSQPHNFKAGALNVLLRVSGIISNAPYVLALDCDMYSNDPSSARQAMCFHLDPQMSPSLAFVQFPQEFHNISKNDIYNGQLTSLFKILWHGMNGLQGPILSGTGFYLKREALFRSPTQKDVDLLPGKRWFGSSKNFIASLHQNHTFDTINSEEETSLLASCAYEEDTKWGEEIGFMYHCVVEDYFTGFRMLHCRGWKSVYLYPSRPVFLGSVTTNLNDCLVQNTRWNSGVLQVGLSKFSPLIYGPSRIPILQCMCYAYFALQPLGSLALLCYALVPQLCLLIGIPLYPKVSNPWFCVFPIVYVSCQIQHLLEVLAIEGSFKLWWNQSRSYMVRTVTAYSFSCLDIVMKWIGLKEIKFMPTNKATTEEQEERYNNDIFDFHEATIFLLPLTTIVNLNVASFAVGISKAVVHTTYDEMFVQTFISFLLLFISYPIIEGMVLRKDRGRIPTSVTLSSVAFVTIIVSLGFFH